MQSIKALLLLLFSCLLLAGCASVSVEDYADEQPELDLLEYFSGPVEAWGMFQNRSGKVVTRFHVQIDSRREGDRLILDEHFSYSDGTTQRRVWTLTPDGPKGWRGTAEDVVGEASGQLAGNAFRWRYTLSLPVDGRVWEVHFDDWMYLMDEDTLINRASMRKFGIEWGQVTLFFRRQ
ncbi:DUF3833 domain-containing protein [Halopseudomonas yangmingensis]|uniref:DUF3833 domain-containing protein n=1 Tax=Halopseudomonas yangmingensis TaxID=1720063 RepID=A0A1I4UC12_9GAMM|nr:DUF3833 domain-containing protein [Halopseudomonas yangmingensis]SFM86527.1 Protein of unknown function [Halopseudomonas yangmingensis]